MFTSAAVLGKAFLLLTLTFVLCSANDERNVDFGFEWQQRLSSLGLEENNVTSLTGCVQACEWLVRLLPQHEVLPSDVHYFKVKDFYWSAQQRETAPECFVQPASPEDVSVIVKVAERTECPFAVKAGGHAAYAGASNIDGGITIDLQLLNELTVSEDKTITRVGPGNRWVDVYSHLTPQSLSVVGGRVAEIGVGGLVLGGGISFFSGRYGWALDGVRNFQVVVASGEILDVNHESFPDLYWALRGGGNNFGIVTRFDLETFPQGGMWGGMAYHSPEQSETLLDALHAYSHRAPEDVDAHAYIAYCWAKDYNTSLIASMLTYARPVEYPEILKNFTDVPSSQSTLRLTDIHDLTIELNSSNPNGLRQIYQSGTFAMNREMLQMSAEAFHQDVEPIKYIEGTVPCLVLQIMSKDVIARFGRNGGNCLGVEEDEGPLVNVLFANMWRDPTDDEVVLKTAKGTINRIMGKAKELGVAHRYIYQNYAGQHQDVFAGYGEENLKRLKEISEKYDPLQVFQRLQPGYFKL